jgi:type I restriction enzyme S subunit
MYPTKKLSEICKFQNWFAFKSELFRESWQPIIRISNIQDNDISYEKLVYFNPEEYKEDLSKYIVKRWDLVIAMSWATTWKIAINQNDDFFYLNQRVGLFRFEDEVTKIYTHYFLGTKIQENLKQSVWSAIPNLSSEQIKNIEIPLPPLSTQSRIVARLDSAFASIAEQISLLRANIADVENMRKSVVESVFIWNESVIIQKLVQKTETWNPTSIGDDTFQYIDISSIDNSQFVLTETKSITGKDAPSRAKKLVQENDVIFATTRPNLKNIAIVDRDLENLTCSTGFCVLRTKKELLNFRYLFYYLISDIVANKISPMIRWAGYPAISDKDLLSIDIPLPPLPRQHQIVAHLDRVFAETEALRGEYEAQIRDLETLKQSLLEEAFAGRLITD